MNTQPLDFIFKKYEDVQAELLRIAKANPKNAKVFNLGVNDTGQMIQGLAAGKGPIRRLVVATHHGNEYGSAEVALAMAKSLAEQPLKHQTVYVIPVLNVSGYNARQRRELGKDPNRNYPGPCGTEGPFTLKSTKLVAEFVREQNISASVTLHTFSPAVLYPWGFATHDLKTEYDDLYISLAKEAVVESHYKVGNSTTLLYPANGAFEDYVMLEYGVWSLLFEMGHSHSPGQDSVDQMIKVNTPGIRRYFENAPFQRAEKHVFRGRCDDKLMGLDRHDE